MSSPPSKMRRGRGRPKKKTSATLEEDLQFSSEEELDEVPLNEFEDSKTGILISAEMPDVEGAADDDSQQAAEAMVQLGTMGYYHQQEGDGSEALMFKEESLDVDPNYDPSDFLMAGLPKMKPEEIKLEDDVGKIHDDLAVSESDEEGTSLNTSGQPLPDDDDGGELWF